MKRINKRNSTKKPQVKPIQFANQAQITARGLDDVMPIAQFLENFKQLTDPRAQYKSKLISIKIPEPLLAAFKYKASLEKTPYQTMIKILMTEWLNRNS